MTESVVSIRHSYSNIVKSLLEKNASVNGEEVTMLMEAKEKLSANCAKLITEFEIDLEKIKENKIGPFTPLSLFKWPENPKDF
ncbi:MAG TPA: hypothetical protein ENI08_02000 [Candidatus Dependentiae bacterium]|nr:hypothetical protein [Candidatus Dependentiae bacterium]